jgi:hypothetical protein
MTLHVKVQFKDGTVFRRDYPGFSWDTRSHQALFAADIREAEAAAGSQDHDGAWMEHSTP